MRYATYFPRVSEKWRFSESEFVSNSANSWIRVGVDTFSVLSELSLNGARFPSSFAVLQVLADWSVVFDSGALGVMR